MDKQHATITIRIIVEEPAPADPPLGVWVGGFPGEHGTCGQPDETISVASPGTYDPYAPFPFMPRGLKLIHGDDLAPAVAGGLDLDGMTVRGGSTTREAASAASEQGAVFDCVAIDGVRFSGAVPPSTILSFEMLDNGETIFPAEPGEAGNPTR